MNPSFDEDNRSPQESSNFHNTDRGRSPGSYNGGECTINTSLTKGNNSTYEESIVLESRPYNFSTNSSQNCFSSEGEMTRFPEKSPTSDSFQESSFVQREKQSITYKEKESHFKELLEKVNGAHVKWKMNGFVLDTIKTKHTSYSKKIREATKSSEIQQNIKLRSEGGEVMNLLGLEEEDIKPCINRSMAVIHQPDFREHIEEVLKANVAKLKLQKQSCKETFGAHSMKATVGIMTKERMEQIELQNHVEDLQSQARQLLNSCYTILQQLTTLRHNADQQLQLTSYDLIRNKALFLQTVISTLKEKLDHSLLLDENIRKKIDLEGDSLKVQVAGLREELKALQKTLAEYEKKERSSVKYKEIVSEYGKLKKQFEHKKETLRMLKEDNHH